jgi:ATP-binding cassette subfamily F protein 3
VKPILDDVTYHFPEGERVALVGANGAGKTTLLDILTGTQEIDAGSILKPARIRLGYLPQEPNPNPSHTVLDEAVSGGEGYLQALYRRHRDALALMTNEYSDENFHKFEQVDLEFQREGGYAMESDAKAILRGLGFSDQMIEVNPATLSGGWRMRLELGKIFINRPNFLILDEPTNHLDLPSLIWVEKWLQSYQGTLVFVSHDRSLLDRLPTYTIYLSKGRMTSYKGNFSSFLEQRELRAEQDAATAENLKRQREHLQSFVDRFGAKATKAAQAQSRMKMIAKIRDMEEDVPTEDTQDSIALKIPVGQPSGREVLKIDNASIGYDKPLASGIKLLVERHQKIAIIGANGIGKSTLLKAIAGHIQPLSGTFTQGHNVLMAWFAQDQLDTLDVGQSALYNVMQSSHETSEREARSLLGSLLFRGDDVFKNVGVLSGGEKARVGLAKLLAQRSNFLVMDEPTNHLDLSSVEILTQALQDYQGTLLFVSHDRNFIDAVCTHIFVMLPDGRSSLFVGKLEDYQRLARQSGFPDVLDPAPVSSAASVAAGQSSKTNAKSNPKSTTSLGATESNLDPMKARKEIQKLEKRLKDVDSALEASRKEITYIDSQLEKSGADYSQISAMSSKRNELEQHILNLEEEWLSTSDRIEALREIK